MGDPPYKSMLITTHALRVALACTICLIVAEYFQLDQPGLAVWSAYMIMVQFTFTTFQKGIERILGRGLGIVIALLIATLTRNAPELGFVLEMLAIVPLFYVYFSDRLSYTFLNAGLYLAAVMQAARQVPDSVFPLAWSLFVAIVFGVIVAVLTSWITGSESDMMIHTEGEAIFPLDRHRINHSIMLMLTVATAQITSHFLHLSATTALVSVVMLTITPHFQSLFWKGTLRLEGAILAILYSFIALGVLIRIPSFVLLAVFVFLGIFIAVSLARQSDDWGYAGLQMGLVLPMIMIMPHHQFGSIQNGLERVVGVLVALGSSIIVGFLWAALSPTPPLPILPPASTLPRGREPLTHH
jgi:uncharacterized membrane protein YccC